MRVILTTALLAITAQANANPGYTADGISLCVFNAQLAGCEGMGTIAPAELRRLRPVAILTAPPAPTGPMARESDGGDHSSAPTGIDAPPRAISSRPPPPTTPPTSPPSWPTGSLPRSMAPAALNTIASGGPVNDQDNHAQRRATGNRDAVVTEPFDVLDDGRGE